MSVDTTFLPKTNGMVFGERLEARAAKGRVFLLVAAGDEIVLPPPSMEPITVSINGTNYDYREAAPLTASPGSTFDAVVASGGNASPTYLWSSRGSGDVSFSDASSGTTTITVGATSGMTYAQCVISDPNSLEDQISILINFLLI